MKFLKYLLPLLALLFFSSLSCKKKPSPKPTYYMSQEFKDYVVFPEGSWWVYEDSVSSIKDTIKATRYEVHTVAAEWLHYITQNIVLHNSSSYYDTRFLLMGGVQTEEMEVLDILLEKDEQNFHNIFFLPADIGDKESQGLGIYKYYYDSLKIKNLMIDSIHLYQSQIALHSSLPVKVYWKRNIGIVKKEMSDGTVWELIEYYINN